MSAKIYIIGLIGFIALLVGVAVFANNSGGQTQTPKTPEITYSSSDAERPKAEASVTNFDLGDMKVSEDKKQDFEIKNTGSKPLQILNVSSSCGCTTGQIIYKDQESPEFGMHSQSAFVTEIAPDDSAKVRVTYRPSVMPVYGAVEREVYVTTNDPDNGRMVFSVTANVKE
ncbi:MAG: DUF1573 domain-containing protein [bacterium]|nr:DUF1573 domain-containing protein [bacterium]